MNKVDFCIAGRDLQTDGFSLVSCRAMISIMEVSSPVAGSVCGLHPNHAGYSSLYIWHLFVSLQFALLQWLNM